MENNEKVVHAVWNPEKALEGVFCPECGTWMNDYYGQPERCPECGVKLEGWVDGSEEGAIYEESS